VQAGGNSVHVRRTPSETLTAGLRPAKKTAGKLGCTSDVVEGLKPHQKMFRTQQLFFGGAMESHDQNSQLFLQMVFMYHAACMEHLGKVKSTITGKIERNLAAAQQTIDLLDMLKEKTKGNLSSEEEKLLTQLIRELKLNYVDEVNKDQKSAQDTAPHHEEAK
jgi:hypothetical protein